VIRRTREPFDLERELHSNRPEPRPDFLRTLARRIKNERPSGFSVPRLLLAGGLTAALLAGLGATGAISDAASAPKAAVVVLKRAVTPTKADKAVRVVQSSPAINQYVGGQGCTPGFWKNHEEAWEGFTTGQTLESVFDIPNGLGLDNATLLEALEFGGGSGVLGASQNLLRIGVAALLNAAHSGVNYPLSTAAVITAINTALASNNATTIEAQKDALDILNNAGCPLS
jgi:hypothetical protein